MEEEKRIEIKVLGMVQGVFFRSTTRDKAKKLGLKGTVRNMRDGSVEIIAEGTKRAQVVAASTLDRAKQAMKLK